MLGAWVERMNTFGQGSFTAMEAADAIRVAHEAEPEARPAKDLPYPHGLERGKQVHVAADDYGCDRISGEVIFSDTHEITIRRIDPRAGTVAVHFPRAGFNVFPA
jgi:hypothetical protein